MSFAPPSPWMEPAHREATNDHLGCRVAGGLHRQLYGEEAGINHRVTVRNAAPTHRWVDADETADRPDVLPAAIGTAISPVPIIAVVLMLLSPRLTAIGKGIGSF